MRNAVILSCGAFAPDQVITNSYFNEKLGEDVDSWLKQYVEIYERRWCAEGESTADLCEAASKTALERAGISANDLDLIIVATDTPEYVSPSTASVLQDRLGANQSGTFDVNAACAGFVTALDIGSKYIISDHNYRYVLVVGAYAMSKFLNKADKKTVTLFADGAGAVILKAEENTNRGFLASELITEGKYNSWMGIYGGAAATPTNETVLANHDHQLKFVHKFPKELNPQIWSKMAKDLCKRINVRCEEVDRFFITQININSIRETMALLEQDVSKATTIMHHYGYTGSACIPMALNESWEKGEVNAGDLIFFIGSGGGLSFASAAFRM